MVSSINLITYILKMCNSCIVKHLKVHTLLFKSLESVRFVLKKLILLCVESFDALNLK